MARNKVVLGTGEVLIDLTADTITPDDLTEGKTAHDKSGAVITGINTMDSDTSDADAMEAEIIAGRTAYVKGEKVIGTMPFNGSAIGEINSKHEQYHIPIGFHDGSGTVAISEEAKLPIIPTNIKKGINILGVVGTMDGSESVTVQTKSVVPTLQGVTVNPDVGYDYLSSVAVEPIPYKEVPNPQGGTTVTIG